MFIVAVGPRVTTPLQNPNIRETTLPLTPYKIIRLGMSADTEQRLLYMPCEWNGSLCCVGCTCSWSQLGSLAGCSSSGFFCTILCTVLSQWEFLLMGNSGRFPPRKASCNRVVLPNPNLLKCIAGSFHVSIIHHALTWTTGSLTCVGDHSYACVYTQGVGHADSESAEHF